MTIAECTILTIEELGVFKFMELLMNMTALILMALLNVLNDSTKSTINNVYTQSADNNKRAETLTSYAL